MLVVAYATGRASHARQVKGDDTAKKGYPGPLCWGLGVRLTTSPGKKILLWNLKRSSRTSQGCRADDNDILIKIKFICAQSNTTMILLLIYIYIYTLHYHVQYTGLPEGLIL